MSKIKIPYNQLGINGSYGIFTSIYGETYVVPAWIKVPTGTKYEDIEVIDKPVKPKANRRELSIQSKSGNTYRVIIDSQLGNSCECVGFMYHRNCRHLKQVLEN